MDSTELYFKAKRAQQSAVNAAEPTQQAILYHLADLFSHLGDVEARKERGQP